MKRQSYLGDRGYVGYRTRLEIVRDIVETREPLLISRPAEVYSFLRNVRNRDRESLYSILLDAANQVIGCDEVARGQLNSTSCTPREIYKGALLANALGTILAHNHPSGSLEPSSEDIEFTRAVSRAGEVLGVELYDHVIVTHTGYTSLRERGLF